MDDLTKSRITAKAIDGAILGTTFSIIFISALLIVTILAGNREQETLNDIRDANEQFVAGVLCGLAAPTEQEEQPDGTVETRRPERFVNRVCLINLGFEPVDVDGDGEIEVSLSG